MAARTLGASYLLLKIERQPCDINTATTLIDIAVLSYRFALSAMWYN
jgi:hypothetical protein